MRKIIFAGNLPQQYRLTTVPKQLDGQYVNELHERRMWAQAQKDKTTDLTPDDIHYKTNAFGFRCDEFTASDAPAVMFTGCSLTFGDSLPLQDVWAHRVYSKLKKNVDRDLRYINLGRPGGSIDHVVRSTIAFGNSYNPAIVVGLLPPVARTEYYGAPGHIVDILPAISDDLKHERRNDFNGESHLSIAAIEDSLLADEYFHAYRTAKNLQMLDLFRQATGCEMLLSTWVQLEDLCRHFDDDFSHLFIKETFSLHPEWPADVLGTKAVACKAAMDGIHPGPMHHEAFAHIMYPYVEAALKRQLEKSHQ